MSRPVTNFQLEQNECRTVISRELTQSSAYSLQKKKKSAVLTRDVSTRLPLSSSTPCARPRLMPSPVEPSPASSAPPSSVSISSSCDLALLPLVPPIVHGQGGAPAALLHHRAVTRRQSPATLRPTLQPSMVNFHPQILT
jgi:hypothetical protein